MGAANGGSKPFFSMIEFDQVSHQTKFDRVKDIQITKLRIFLIKQTNKLITLSFLKSSKSSHI